MIDRFTTSFLAASLVLLFHLIGMLRASADESSKEAHDFFERKVRPVLADNCYKCHGPEKQKGSLRLDGREAMLAGGENGPALIPGNAGQSRLIKAIRSADPDLQMPPKKRLSDRQVADLIEWVKRGALWPPGDKRQFVEPKGRTFEITEKDRAYWAFQPVQRPELPILKTRAAPANAIDAFVLAEL